MILLNFSHPLTNAQRAQIETLAGEPIERLIDAPAQFDPALPFAGQTAALVDACGLAPAEWQTEPLLLVPPALNFIAVTLLAELHGRMGYFCPIVRLCLVQDAGNGTKRSPGPPRYEAAEIINLQKVRDQARKKR